jgi:hypothetical protein
MKYHEIAADRFRLPASHPILSRLTIDPAEWFRLQQFDDDNPATKIVGHDEPLNGLMNVYVACASDEVRRRLEDGWD